MKIYTTIQTLGVVCTGPRLALHLPKALRKRGWLGVEGGSGCIILHIREANIKSHFRHRRPEWSQSRRRKKKNTHTKDMEMTKNSGSFHGATLPEFPPLRKHRWDAKKGSLKKKEKKNEKETTQTHILYTRLLLDSSVLADSGNNNIDDNKRRKITSSTYIRLGEVRFFLHSSTVVFMEL